MTTASTRLPKSSRRYAVAARSKTGSKSEWKDFSAMNRLRKSLQKRLTSSSSSSCFASLSSYLKFLLESISVKWYLTSRSTNLRRLRETRASVFWTLSAWDRERKVSSRTTKSRSWLRRGGRIWSPNARKSLMPWRTQMTWPYFTRSRDSKAIMRLIRPISGQTTLMKRRFWPQIRLRSIKTRRLRRLLRRLRMIELSSYLHTRLIELTSYLVLTTYYIIQ